MAKKKADVTSEIIDRLRENLESLRREATSVKLSALRRNKLNLEIQRIVWEIEKLLREIDPIKLPPAIFDPGNPDLVGRFIALALVAQPRVSLTELKDFYGAGVYAIYYRGLFKTYLPISGKEVPIYVGKADPDSALARTPIEQKTKLAGRLGEHRRSIERAASTLDIKDFECRYLVVQTGWEKPAESFLINFFQPVWNSETGICFGLGKHGDSMETRSNKRSPWDTLHPGRKWAEGIVGDAMSEPTIREKLADHFLMLEAENKLFKDINDVLNAFIEGLNFSGTGEA